MIKISIFQIKIQSIIGWSSKISTDFANNALFTCTSNVEPIENIVSYKIDLRSAFTCAHLHRMIAGMNITVVRDFALISLRLTFWGTCCVYSWNVISEFIYDTANVLIRRAHWIPNQISFYSRTRHPTHPFFRWQRSWFCTSTGCFSWPRC